MPREDDRRADELASAVEPSLPAVEKPPVRSMIEGLRLATPGSPVPGMNVGPRGLGFVSVGFVARQASKATLNSGRTWFGDPHGGSRMPTM